MERIVSDMGDVIVLFEHSGLSAAPWVASGFDVWNYDKINEDRSRIPESQEGDPLPGTMHWRQWDCHKPGAIESLVERHRGRARLILGFPPCDDLASSGARHFDKKLGRDPLNRMRAMFRVRFAEGLARRLAEVDGLPPGSIPWCIENPVGAISTHWRESDMRFDPWEFGGWLPDGDVHPLFPGRIPPRDAYWKRTCYWWGNGFRAPVKNPLPSRLVPEPGTSHLQRLGSGSHKVKLLRNCSPRGVAIGVWLANHQLISGGPR